MVLVFVIGIFPNPLLTRMHATVAQLIAEPKSPAVAIEPRRMPGTASDQAAAIPASLSNSYSNQAAGK